MDTNIFLKMNAQDLLIHKKADDKHYLVGRNIELIKKNIIELHFSSEDQSIHFENIGAFQDSHTIQGETQKEQLESNEWLLSMGAIVLFGETVKKSEVLLIQRDEQARHDPLKYTMPAGRLDTTLSHGCMAELFEEVIIEGIDNYYQIDKGVCDCANIQKERIKNLELPNKPFTILPSQGFSLSNLYTVRMFLDNKEINNVDNVFLYIDKQNKTLEFRQLLLCNKPNDIIALHDGDNYGRNVSIENLKGFLNQEEIVDFKNCTPTLQYFLQNLSL